MVVTDDGYNTLPTRDVTFDKPGSLPFLERYKTLPTNTILKIFGQIKYIFHFSLVILVTQSFLVVYSSVLFLCLHFV